MQAVTLSEAQNQLPHLLDMVESGEDVLITRQGRPVARLVQSQPRSEPDDLPDTLDQLRAMRAQQNLTPSSVPLIRQMREGRY